MFCVYLLGPSSRGFVYDNLFYISAETHLSNALHFSGCSKFEMVVNLLDKLKEGNKEQTKKEHHALEMSCVMGFNVTYTFIHFLP